MLQRLYDFSDQEGIGIKIIICPIIGLLLAMGTLVSAVELENVRAYEVQWQVEPSGKIRVGDRLQVQITGPVEGLTQNNSVILDVPEGSDSLLHLGWMILETEVGDSQNIFFTIATVRSGARVLPPLTLRNEKNELLGRTKVFSFQVIPVQPKKGSKGELEKPPEVLPPVGLNFPKWIWGILSAVLLVITSSKIQQ